MRTKLPLGLSLLLGVFALGGASSAQVPFPTNRFPVIVNGTQLQINDCSGRRFFLAGMVDNKPNSGRQLSRYDHAEMETQIVNLKAIGATAMRWNTFLFGRDLRWDANGYCTGMCAHAVANIKDGLDLAYKHRIVIQIVLSTAHWLSYGTQQPEEVTRVNNNRFMFTNAAATQAYIDNVIKPITRTIGVHPGLFGYCIINEASGMYYDEDAPTGTWSDVKVHKSDFQRWVNRVASEIHDNQPGALCSVSGVAAGIAEYADAALIAAGGKTNGIMDIHQVQFYPNNHGEAWSPFLHTPRQLVAAYGGGLKPFICGETPIEGIKNDGRGKFKGTEEFGLGEGYIRLYTNGHSGGFTWSYNVYENPKNAARKPAIDAAYHNLYDKYLVTNDFNGSQCPDHAKAQSPNVKRPNVLFCITDDQSWVHTSFAGEKAITTPAFDRVAREGIYFRNAFCAAPSCSPSRGSIITGQEMWRLGEAAQLYSAVPKELEKVSFPLLLEGSGYFIGHTQKGWEPNDFKVHGWTEYPLGKAYNKQRLQPPASGIVSNDYAANFAEFLNDCPENKPFFFWFGSSEPHRAFEGGSGAEHGVDPSKVVVPGFLPDVPEVRNDIADYLFEIQWVDQHLGKMMALLKERNQLDNTVIIVTSDNGMPFPSAKNNLYEYGLHMPLAIRWPEGIKRGGRTVEDLVNLTDLAPTLLECAGIREPVEMTGRSLVEIFNSMSSGRVDKSRNYVFAGKERHTVCRADDLPYPQRSVRDHQFLYIRNLEPDRWPAGAPDVPSVHGWVYGDIDKSPSLTYLMDHQNGKGVKGLFELAVAKRPGEELYDIVADPFCLANLASKAEFAKDKGRLARALDDYRVKTADPRALTGKSAWDTFPYYHQNPKGLVPYPKMMGK